MMVPAVSRGLKIYLDGALATLQVTVDRLSETIRCDFPFAIGSRERRDYYQGRIDEVRAYDRTLTADEIFELYDVERSNLDPAAGSTLNRGLVGYWSFDGSPAESLRDKSGHGHDGKPEVDLGLPEIVDSDGGQAVRLERLGNGRLRGRGRFRPRGSVFPGRVVQAAWGWFKNPDGNDGSSSTEDFDLVFDSHVICHLVSQWEGSAIRISHALHVSQRRLASCRLHV